MIPHDLIITRKSSKKLICKVTIKAIVQSNTFLVIDIPFSIEQ